MDVLSSTTIVLSLQQCSKIDLLLKNSSSDFLVIAFFTCYPVPCLSVAKHQSMGLGCQLKSLKTPKMLMQHLGSFVLGNRVSNF